MTDVWDRMSASYGMEEFGEDWEDKFAQHVVLPSERDLPWMQGRRDNLLHHIDSIDAQPAPTDTVQFSIIGMNMGNLDRGMVMAFCCGKFHLALVAEAWLTEHARMTTKTFDVSVFTSRSGSLGIWILGNAQDRWCETLLENTVLSKGIRKDGSRKWLLDYMVGEAYWGNHELSGDPVIRSGISSLRCGVAHLNNKAAKQRRLQMLKGFWQAMINARAQVVFGDFNKRAYLSTHDEVDRPNNTVKACLETAILESDIEIKFTMLRADAGTTPTQGVLACHAEEDCLLFFLLDYADVDFKITLQHISKSSAQEDNASLGLKSTDKDWHTPMLVHVRSSDMPSGHRQRSSEAKARRKKADTARRNAAKREKHGDTRPPVRAAALSELH